MQTEAHDLLQRPLREAAKKKKRSLKFFFFLPFQCNITRFWNERLGLGVCCITHSKWIIHLSHFSEFIFYSHVMFYVWYGCHLSESSPPLRQIYAQHSWCAASRVSTVLTPPPKKKICSCVMQMSWFTSTGGHKLMHSLASCFIPKVAPPHWLQSAVLWLLFDSNSMKRRSEMRERESDTVVL